MPGRDGIPVTVITGHLGAGKTTLLNRLLAANRRHATPRRLVVIENEFAMEFGVEEQLLLSHCEPSNAENVFEVFEFGTGCLCCSSFKQFVVTLMTVAASAAEVDHVLVETMGLAGGGPDGTGWAPVFQEPTLAEHFRLQGVVTVVDAANFLRAVQDVDRPAGARNEAAEQVAVASVVVLNKLDLVGHDPHAVAAVEKELRALNPTLRRILRSVQAEVDADALLGSTGPLVPTPEPSPSSQHDASVTAHCLVRDASLDEAATVAWVSGLMAGNENVLRLKAVVPAIGASNRLILQGVLSKVDVSWGAPWATDELRTAKVVVIGRHIDVAALRREFDSLPSEDG